MPQSEVAHQPYQLIEQALELCGDDNLRHDVDSKPSMVLKICHILHVGFFLDEYA